MRARASRSRWSIRNPRWCRRSRAIAPRPMSTSPTRATRTRPLAKSSSTWSTAPRPAPGWTTPRSWMTAWNSTSPA